ncbi:hypothetical protein Droror1_Dr00019610 [Drosera rotundifolia]
MAGVFKSQQGSFTLTPHKVSLCVLIQVYGSPGEFILPNSFSSVSQHNRFGLFLLTLTKSCDDIFEPKLEELVSQLRKISGLLDLQLHNDLIRTLSSFVSPDDLFNFFSELRGIVGGSDSGVIEDDQISLDPCSNLGKFLRRCILAFNVLAFECVCHLLSNIELYCKEITLVSRSGPFQSGDSQNEFKVLSYYERMELENISYENIRYRAETGSKAKVLPFHLHAPKAITWLAEDVRFSPKTEEGAHFSLSSISDAKVSNESTGMFLRANWQMQGYFLNRADQIEMDGSSFLFNTLEAVLRQLLKLAPDLHRVHFFRYMNNLCHDDCTGALENLHRYFDYSAGMEGFDDVSPLPGCNVLGRHEIALLCLGMMHCHFGHPKQALEVLLEGICASQQRNNDTCLSYALTAICNLLSDFGVRRITGVLGSSYSPVTGKSSSLNIEQQLYVLLRRSISRAEGLKLARLVSANHLSLAKFDMRHVRRPLLSFGPKACTTLRTCPPNVIKELRLSAHVICEFGSDSSMTAVEGAFSTAWIRSLDKETESTVFSLENGFQNFADAFEICAQPCSIPRSVLQLVGSSFLLRATAWETYGSSTLARMNTLVFATCYADGSSMDDVAMAYAKLVQHLAMHKGYREAFSAFKIVEEKFQGSPKSWISILKLQLLHDIALHRGHLQLAERACDELSVLASPETGVDMELKTESGLRRARTLLAAKQYQLAAQVATSVSAMCYEFNMQLENAAVLLFLADIHKRSGNPVLGLPYALASLSFCQSLNSDLLKASVNLTLAEIWLALGSCEAKRALSLLYGAFPIILGHGGLELRARAHIVEAKCYLADTKYSAFHEPEVVLDPLKQACEALQVLQFHELAVEAFYLTAIVYDKLGNIEEREKAAASFKEHTLALRNPTISEDDYLFKLLQ